MSVAASRAFGRLTWVARESRLFGRPNDAAAVATHLARHGRCTIVGPGGVGKSSVARAVVGAVVDRPVVWVAAEPVDDVNALLERLVRQMELDRLPGEEPADAARAGLDGTPVLIVLDGVEHVADDLAAITATWPLSPDGPWLLMTSRRPLGPRALPVARLAPLPIIADVVCSPAAEMLLDEIARRGGEIPSLKADTERFGRVLESTGGLPAAIQLTADHVARFGLRFADEHAPPLDEIVDNCIGRTLTLLDETDQLVFTRLGLTAGSFTLALIDACRGDTRGVGAQDVAGRLVEHGLLLAEDGRFDMLPPVRDGATELLARRGDTETALELLLSWAVDDCSAAARVANLETCLHLVRLGVGRSELRARSVALANLVFGPMYDQARGPELLSLIEAALTCDGLDPADGAEIARRAAICAAECDTLARARRWLDRAYQLAEQLADDGALVSRLWATDGWLSLHAGDHARAISSAHRAIAAAGVDGPARLMFRPRRCLAEAALAMGDLDRVEQIAAQLMQQAAAEDAGFGLEARTTLGWCLVERGRLVEAVAYARRLGDDIAHHDGELAEIAIEAELIAIAADPRIEPRAPSFDNEQRFTWWMRLQQRIRLAARLPIADNWEHVMHTAADVVVLADLVPLSYPRLCATLLLGDAAVAGDDLPHAARNYEQSLRDARRGPYWLRSADAFDGIAVVATRLGHNRLAGQAAAAPEHIRERVGAAPWPRPSLPETVDSAGPVPPTWIRDNTPTAAAIEEIASTLHRPVHRDRFDSLTTAERHVAQLVRQGMSNNEIAIHLTISRRTVESHLGRIFRKLDIRSRTQLATIANR
jgi:DNA-binding CsgD family transcriptional regulator